MTGTAHRHFDDELARLKDRLLQISTAAQEALDRAVRAVLQRDVEAADRVVQQDPAIDALESEIEETVTNLLALHQPMAQLARGLSITFRSMLEKPFTIQYPEEKRPVRTRFKGRHQLHRYENGLEKCIGCSLCAAACPADAIFVESAENTDEQRYSPGERYASTYEINMLRCIFCGYCEDACPTEAIVLGDNYELSFTNRRQASYTKEMLVTSLPPNANQHPR